jgi:hypothetical protein
MAESSWFHLRMPNGLLFLALSGCVFGAVAFDNATDLGIVNPGTSLSHSHTVSGSNRVLLVGVFGDSIGTDTSCSKITGVTYNSVAMTLITKSSEFNGRCI